MLKEEKMGFQMYGWCHFSGAFFSPERLVFQIFSGWLYHSNSAALKCNMYELHKQQACESSWCRNTRKY